MELHYYGWIVAGLFVVLASFFSVYLIYKHLRNYTRPHEQRCIVRILLMVPIYSIDSWFSLVFIDYAIYFDLLRDSYEAYVIYQFFVLLVMFVSSYDIVDSEGSGWKRVNVSAGALATESTPIKRSMEGLVGSHRAPERAPDVYDSTSYEDPLEAGAFGGARAPEDGFEIVDIDDVVGEKRVVQILEAKGPQNHPFPLCCVSLQFSVGRKFLLWTKRLILQFVIIKPACAVAAAVMQAAGVYHPGSFDPRNGYLYITVIENISIFIAVYFLVLFYRVLAKELKPSRPIGKFLAIKGLVFFTFWQSVIIAILVFFNVISGTGGWTAGNVAEGIQDFLICFEMLLFSIWHAWVFGYKSYRETQKVPMMYVNRSVAPMARNIRHVISQKDMIDDTVESFALRPVDMVKEAAKVPRAAATAGAKIVEPLRRQFSGNSTGELADSSDSSMSSDGEGFETS